MAEIASFHDVRFPLGVSFGATAGPEWRNEIVTLTSGHEKRNARWAQSRRHFDAGTGLRSLDDLKQVLAFFEARRGSLYAFRFRDPFDHVAKDERIGTGDGRTAIYPLVKRYGDGADAYVRPIGKPVAGSVKIAVGGVEMVEGEAFTVDGLTGIVTFAADTIPLADKPVTAGFVFDVAARFDTDRLTASIATFQAGEIPSIPIIEVKA
ncbi:DUF2460 domain-containing protein [Phyllobacterium leguminum]|uniref:Uncharacterized protein (TIGR02217 family) n=1 Tax=Phyllobacterium leguminum TaxID=314237 RepID=A0A318T378_9HYPH|nr:DUF2460 domain-containing protein [Phyllobacterium leguminum]PYE88393.1 uncharacterized protein (TIGR02217 family) [Phyllobacterium leguminum]